jgi:hypothetical protein
MRACFKQPDVVVWVHTHFTTSARAVGEGCGRPALWIAAPAAVLVGREMSVVIPLHKSRRKSAGFIVMRGEKPRELKYPIAARACPM